MKLFLFILLFPFFLLSQNKNYCEPFEVKIFMNGNSLLASNSTHTIGNARYISSTLQNYFLSQGYKFSMFDYSLGGQTQSQINAKMYSQTNCFNLNKNSIVFIWEITNELGINQSITAIQAFNVLVAYTNYIKIFTDKYIVGTCIARNFSTDLPTLMPKIDSVNTMIRNYYPPVNILDLAANQNFNTKAKAAISPPYATDELHLITQGCDTVISLIKPKFLYFLNN